MPNSPLSVRTEPHGELAQLFGMVRGHLEAVDPDVLVLFDTDHFATWYYQKLPVFAVGVASETSGPGTDDWPGNRPALPASPSPKTSAATCTCAGWTTAST